MTGTIKQTVVFRASPHEVYEMLMDSQTHSLFTGAAARISRRVGGVFSAYDGWIVGKNVELVNDKKIVQLWKGSEKDWPPSQFSTVSFSLTRTAGGTRLVLVHSNIPAGWKTSLAQGWQDYYWTPMKKYLSDSR